MVLEGSLETTVVVMFVVVLKGSTDLEIVLELVFDFVDEVVVDDVLVSVVVFFVVDSAPVKNILT